MTAFYVFRAFFLAFFGEYRGKLINMTITATTITAMRFTNRRLRCGFRSAVLAVLSLVGGFINIPKFLEPMFPAAGRRSAPRIRGLHVSVAVGLGGIALAYCST